MRERRTYGSGRGARGETRVPTVTLKSRQLVVFSLKGFVHDLVSPVIKRLHAASVADLDSDHNVGPNTSVAEPAHADLRMWP